jgi:hypothetical protein
VNVPGHEPAFTAHAAAGPTGNRVMHTYDCQCGAHGVWRPNEAEARIDWTEHVQACDEVLCACGSGEHEHCACTNCEPATLERPGS